MLKQLKQIEQRSFQRVRNFSISCAHSGPSSAHMPAPPPPFSLHLQWSHLPRSAGSGTDHGMGLFFLSAPFADLMLYSGRGVGR